MSGTDRPPSATPDPLLGIAAAAAENAVPERTLRRWVAAGKVPSEPDPANPRGRLVRERELLAFLALRGVSGQDRPPTATCPDSDRPTATDDSEDDRSPSANNGHAPPVTGQDRAAAPDLMGPPMGAEPPPDLLPTDREKLETAWNREAELLAAVSEMKTELAGLRVQAERVEDLRGELATVNRRLDEAEAARRQAEERHAESEREWRVLLLRSQEALQAVQQRGLPAGTEAARRPWWRWW